MDDLTQRFGANPILDGTDAAQKLYHAADIFLVAATTLSAICPDGRELSLVLTKLEEAQSWANRAIRTTA